MRKLGFFSLTVVVAAIALGVFSPARAKADTWNFGSVAPSGTTMNLGASSYTFTGSMGGVIYALGNTCAFDSTPSACFPGGAPMNGLSLSNSNLSAKNNSGGESGIGVWSDADGTHEISDDSMISLSMVSLNANFGWLTIESVQTGQSFYVCNGVTYGDMTCSTVLPTASTIKGGVDTYIIPVSWSGAKPVLWVSGAVNDTGNENGSTDDVLISSFKTPEPGTLALLAIGLLGLGALTLSRRKTVFNTLAA